MSNDVHKAQLLRLVLCLVSQVPGLLALLCYALVRRGWLLALVPALWLGVSVVAAPCGEVRPRPLASFWCVPAGSSVRVDGVTPDNWGVNTAEDAPVSVLWAQGWWTAIEVEGITIAGSHRVYLPVAR